MNDEQIDDLITRAVLGELDDAESASLDAALAADPARRAELDADLAAAAVVQRLAAEPPPPELRARVLDAIGDVAQGAGDVAQGAGGVAQDAAAVPPASTVVSLDARRRRRLTQTLLAAAAVIALLVGGVLIAGDRGGPSSFDAVAEAPDAELRSLVGSLPGSLRVIYSAREQAIVIDGANLPALAGNQTYQLWFVDSQGVARSAGLFRPSDDGRVMERFDDLDPTGFIVGVTIEPAGGSATPTDPIVASA